MSTHGDNLPSGTDTLARSAGLLLRVLRLRAGLEQGAVAARLGVSQSRISRWERGVSLPDTALAARWLDACSADRSTHSAALSLIELAGSDCPAAELGLRRLVLAQLSGAEQSAGLPHSFAAPPGPAAAAGATSGHTLPGQTPPGRTSSGRTSPEPPEPDPLARLAAGSGLSYDTAAPFFADVAAGLGESQAPRYGPRALIPVPAELLRRDPAAYALRVRGDSMLPLLAEGDIVIVSPRAAVFDGCIVAARVDPDGDVVKQYRRLADGRVQLVPLNSAYPLITLRAAREAISALADRGVSVPPDALERDGQEGQLWGRVVLQLRDL